MLSQTCGYALRAVTYIAQHGTEGPVLAKDIAEQSDVPLRYLQKVLRDLVRSGVLASARGIGGGFRLGRDAKDIRLADVLIPFDDILPRTACPFGNPECGVSDPCPIHDRWLGVVTVYKTFLETTTIGDLISNR